MLHRRSHLLVVSRHCPFPENDGAGAYLFDLLSYLKNGCGRIDVLWLQPDGAWIRRGWCVVPPAFARMANLHLPNALEIGRLRLFPAIWWLPFKARTLNVVKKMLQLLPGMRRRFERRAKPRGASVTTTAPAAAPNWCALPSAAEKNAFDQVLRRVRPEAVLANYCWLAPLLERVTAAKLVLTHDVASHRLTLTGAARSDIPTHLNPAHPEGESALLGRADAILAISEDDAEVFRKMQPAKQVLVVPKSAPTKFLPPDRIQSGRCLFVGGRNPPNEEGLRWFLAEIWPRISAKHPNATLHVCGAIGATLSNVARNVVVRGRVANLEPEYAAAAVVVVPLLRGSGMKIKLVEAASYGKACVTTPVGLQGMPFFAPAVLCASEAASFSEHVCDLLSDASRRDAVGEKLRTAAQQHLSPEASYGVVAQWIQRARARNMPMARVVAEPA